MNNEKLQPSPSLVLMLKILRVIEAERDESQAYTDALAALAAARALLEHGGREWASDPATTFDVLRWLRSAE